MIQEFVFRPFVSYGKAEGIGLGLAIAKKIVEDHGGEIYLDERRRTGTYSGSRFLLPFPTKRCRSRLHDQSDQRASQQTPGLMRTHPGCNSCLNRSSRDDNCSLDPADTRQHISGIFLLDRQPAFDIHLNGAAQDSRRAGTA
jgi:hypothetical protein